jgi:hypothetical protein
MKVLFSVIGSHDFTNQDGPIEHISAIYRPDMIVLYGNGDLPKDVKLLKKFEEENRHIKIVRIHSDINPNRFDSFYDDFGKILKGIKEKYNPCELLVNVTSGTPSMISELVTIHAFDEIHFKAIQVDDPKYNDLEDRTREVVSENLKYKIIKSNVIELVKNYDYVAVKKIAKNILSDETSQLVDEAIRLSEFPKKKKEINSNIFYAILWLEIKYKLKEYRDFVIRLTPLITQLFMLIIGAKKYINDDGVIDYGKIEDSVIANLYVDKYGNQIEYPYDSHFLNVIKFLKGDLFQRCEYIKRFTDDRKHNLRNNVAHQLRPLTLEDLQKSGEPLTVIQYLKELYEPYCKIDENWNLYQKINEEIINLL